MTVLLLEAVWNLITREGECFFIYSVAFDLFMPFSYGNFVVTVPSMKFFNCFISVRVAKGQHFSKWNLINISFSVIHVVKFWDLEAFKFLPGLSQNLSDYRVHLPITQVYKWVLLDLQPLRTCGRNNRFCQELCDLLWSSLLICCLLHFI